MKLNKLLASTALGFAVALGSTAAFADGHAKELTIVSWGGAYTKSLVEAYHKPYIEKTGTKIKSEDNNGGIAEIKAILKDSIVDLQALSSTSCQTHDPLVLLSCRGAFDSHP